MSFGELDEAANRLARKLIESGVGPESLVAVILPRSVELVVTLLAVVKAGGGYLPIDPTYPAERIAYTLGDARPVCVVAAGDVVDVEVPVLDVMALDLANYDGSPVSDGDRRSALRADDIAT